jgi:hypothetical protein
VARYITARFAAAQLARAGSIAQFIASIAELMRPTFGADVADAYGVYTQITRDVTSPANLVSY